MKRTGRVRGDGRLTGRQRRRMERVLRDVEQAACRWAEAQPVYYQTMRAPGLFRALRRLAEVGRCCVVVSKGAYLSDWAKEVAVYRTAEEARACRMQWYPDGFAPVGRSWNSSPANKRPRQGTERRWAKREERAWRTGGMEAVREVRRRRAATDRSRLEPG